ncbi:MAG: choice-of-anchor J domain-containing protein, partial [candidate division Zixibacteria bacterium]
GPIADWLISPSVDFSGRANATLTFHHYHSNRETADHDTAMVVGSTDGGETWPHTVAEYIEDRGTISVPESLSYDISSWAAGQADVKIAFRFATTNGLAWYLDEPRLISDLDTLLFENFDGDWGPFGDNPPTDWTIINEVEPDPPNDNDWSRYNYSTWGVTVARVNHTPSENQNEWLITPSLSFSETALCTLSFYVNYWDDTYSNETDSAFVLLSTDDGISWPVEVAMYTGEDEGGSNRNESLRSYNISAWVQGEDQVKIGFKYVGLAAWWWMVDDVLVTETVLLADNIALLSIDFPTEFLVAGQDYNPVVSVINLGTEQQTFDLNFTVSDPDNTEIYSSTEINLVLDPLQTSQITFTNPFTPSVSGNHTLQATVINPGDEDTSDDIAEIMVPCYEHQGTGGPDDFGYHFIDNTEPEGPVFNWIDISETGTEIEPDLSYFMSASLPIGFTFNFYGADYTTIYVNSHGQLHFGIRDTWLRTNDCPFPDPSTPHAPMAALFWDDLKVQQAIGQGVYYQYFDEPEVDYTVVQWHVSRDDSDGLNDYLEFELVIFEDATLLFQYDHISDLPLGQGQDAAVGLEYDVLPSGISYLCNDDNPANRLQNGLAIEWLIPSGSDCVYIPGDCDHNGTPVELSDVVAMIGIYRGTIVPAYTCDCPPNGSEFAAEGDPNGNCIAFELGDVVTEIAAYRGSGTASGCEDCPGSRRIAFNPGNDTPVVPFLESRTKMKAGSSTD